jgi:hypothetical protein
MEAQQLQQQQQLGRPTYLSEEETPSVAASGAGNQSDWEVSSVATFSSGVLEPPRSRTVLLRSALALIPAVTSRICDILHDEMVFWCVHSACLEYACILY